MSTLADVGGGKKKLTASDHVMVYACHECGFETVYDNIPIRKEDLLFKYTPAAISDPQTREIGDKKKVDTKKSSLQQILAKRPPPTQVSNASAKKPTSGGSSGGGLDLNSFLKKL
jgi:hypothetical protein